MIKRCFDTTSANPPGTGRRERWRCQHQLQGEVVYTTSGTLRNSTQHAARSSGISRLLALPCVLVRYFGTTSPTMGCTALFFSRYRRFRPAETAGVSPRYPPPACLVGAIAAESSLHGTFRLVGGAMPGLTVPVMVPLPAPVLGAAHYTDGTNYVS